MKFVPKSLRLRLVLTALVVEVATICVLVANSVRLNQEALIQEAQNWIESTTPILSASLAAPLVQRDYATIQNLLDEMRSGHGLSYLQLLDHRGRPVAASGRKFADALPRADASIHDDGADGNYDKRIPIVIGGTQYGTLGIGFSTRFLSQSRSALISQSGLVAVLGIGASSLMLTLLGFWLTRHLGRLTRAAGNVAAGNFGTRVRVVGDDEVAKLGHAFNTVASAAQGKIQALAAGEARLSDALRELEKANAIQREYLTQASDERARLNALLSAMQLGILFVDRGNKVIYSNPAFEHIWLVGNSKAHFLGMDAGCVLRSVKDILAQPEKLEERLFHDQPSAQPAEPLEIEMADGRLVTRQGYPVHVNGADIVGYLWVFEDVTRERQTASQILYLAERDPLTGLFNRHRFQDELARVLTQGEREKATSALLFFDIDEFKHVNDTFGHRTGDALLIRVAGEVSAQVRRNEVFARLGGDEFAILCPNVTPVEVQSLAERIVRAIARIPFNFEGNQLRLTCSLGIALYPAHAGPAEDLVAYADTAMYQAKEAGKNTWRMYKADSATSRRMLKRLNWNERIEDALENDRLRLYFQGIHECTTKQLRHMEALVRMVDKDHPGRPIMPNTFIPIAEKSGKILDIDRWVIAECASLLAAHPEVPAIALNLSGRSLDEPTLPRYIADALRHADVSPSRLIVEITETAAVSDLHDAQRFIDAMRESGSQTCLDDFGAGFSSFAYLKHLNVDMLKIDGQFIKNLPSDHDNQVFVRAIIQVAKGLRKSTVAECVEDEGSLQMLRTMGVDLVQGYHLSRPKEQKPAFAVLS
ncbi:MAG: putative bifunctional diguanylate cyclase/phosphodiesterase [Burkholderiales bacterium]